MKMGAGRDPTWAVISEIHVLRQNRIDSQHGKHRLLESTERRVPLERREEPAVHTQQFTGGQQVEIALGPLAGLQGRLVKQAWTAGGSFNWPIWLLAYSCASTPGISNGVRRRCA
jgi:hypothetical protein